jgi:hypothetical protein
MTMSDGEMTLTPGGRRLRAALAAVLVQSPAPELQLVHRWLDTWSGLGAIAAGMHRQGWDLQLTEYGDGHWRATFYVTGQAHSIVGGSACEATPCTAVQRAAWAALKRSAGPLHG